MVSVSFSYFTGFIMHFKDGTSMKESDVGTGSNWHYIDRTNLSSVELKHKGETKVVISGKNPEQYYYSRHGAKDTMKDKTVRIRHLIARSLGYRDFEKKIIYFVYVNEDTGVTRQGTMPIFFNGGQLWEPGNPISEFTKVIKGPDIIKVEEAESNYVNNR